MKTRFRLIDLIESKEIVLPLSFGTELVQFIVFEAIYGSSKALYKYRKTSSAGNKKYNQDENNKS